MASISSTSSLKFTSSLGKPRENIAPSAVSLAKKTSEVAKATTIAPSTSTYQLVAAKSSFASALLDGDHKRSESIAKENSPLSSEDAWLQRAYLGDHTFTNEEFADLSPDLQKNIYSVANIYLRRGLIDRLNQLGMHGNEPFVIESPSVIAPNMDGIEVELALRNLLVTLRENGQLVTAAEMGVPFQSNFQLVQAGEKNYYCKGNDIGRLLGRNHLESIIKEQGLQRVKVPKKFWVSKESGPVSIHIDPTLYLHSSDLVLYAEYIHPVSRNMTQEEEEEVQRLNKVSRSSDDWFGDVIVANDGVYVIDTEADKFMTVTDYFPPSSEGAIRAEDFEPLQGLLDDADEKDPDLFPAGYEERRREMHSQFGFGARNIPFTFNLEEIFKQAAE